MTTVESARIYARIALLRRRVLLQLALRRVLAALIAAAAAGSPSAKWLGLLGVVLASINIFGGFAVTSRMLAMYKKKER